MERAERAKVSLLRYLGCVPFSQTFFGYRQSGWLDCRGRKNNKNLKSKTDPYCSWLLHWSPSQFPRYAFDFLSRQNWSVFSQSNGRESTPLTSSGSYWDSSELEIIWNLNHQTQITTTKPQILRDKHFRVGIGKRFRLRILSYRIPYEFNILQLLSGIGQRRSMNNVCQFIDHLMNEYIQVCH